MIYSGLDRETWCDGLPSDYCFKKGDLIQVDGGCSYKGYKSDIIRMACVGKPDREQEDNFKIALEAFDRSAEAVREGVRCRDVWMQAEKVWSRHGFTDFIKNRRSDNWCTNGHGIGLDIHEPPAISLAEEELLKSGMVITIEAFNTHNGTWPLRDARWWYLIENIVLVKKGGCEILSSSMDNDLWIA
jgi:Xaa-Pro aminopeptidase